MITIHFAGHHPPDLVRELGAISGGLRRLALTGHGVTVPDDIARRWLAGRVDTPGSAPETASPAPVEVTSIPPASAVVAEAAEEHAGLRRPVETEPEPARRRGRPPAARRTTDGG